MNLILFGFKASGKTFLGKRVSRALSMLFIDTDDLIVSSSPKAKKACEVYRSLGEKKFRDLEKKMVLGLAKGQKAVVALGGGAILDPESRDHLQTIGKLFYLKASFETVKMRMPQMPAFVNEEKSIESLQTIYEKRLPIYESIPAILIDVDRMNTDECTRTICKEFSYGF